MSQLRRALIVAAMCLIGSGCSSSTPDKVALDRGLTLPEVAVGEVAIVPPSPDSLLGQVLAGLPAQQGATLPPMPPMPVYDIQDMVKRSSYSGWETDRIDASTYDSLTNSLNAILAKMMPDDAESFDKVVKYVLMQVTRDPLVAKKAATVGKVSDAEILQAIQSTLHQRSPRNVFELADKYMQRSDTPSAPGGSAAQIMGGG